MESAIEEELREAFLPEDEWGVLHEIVANAIQDANEVKVPFVNGWPVGRKNLRGYHYWMAVPYAIFTACNDGRLSFTPKIRKNTHGAVFVVEFISQSLPNVKFHVCQVASPEQLPVSMPIRLEGYEQNLDFWEDSSVIPIKTGLLTFVANEAGLQHVMVGLPHRNGKEYVTNFSLTNAVRAMGEVSHPTEDTSAPATPKFKQQKERRDGQSGK